MRSLILAFALSVSPAAAMADSGLSGGSCPVGIDTVALMRAAGQSAATGRTQVLRTRCGSETRTFLVRETTAGSNTSLRVSELSGRTGPAVIKASEKRDFNASSPARLVRVRRD